MCNATPLVGKFDFGLVTFQFAYCSLHYACGMILLKGLLKKTTHFVVAPDNQSKRAAFLSRLFGTLVVVFMFVMREKGSKSFVCNLEEKQTSSFFFFY